MSYTYDSRKKANNTKGKEATAQAPSMDALMNGTAVPTREQMGHRVDMPDAIREKMENAFGADLSAVKIYESQAVDDADANAITQGSNIAFAPGMLDFTSYGGQALLGHEISHVVSQARGEVTGSGFLNDHALEARADREGAMAAAGQQIAMSAEAMSTVSAASAAGPMQAGKKERRANKKLDKLHQLGAMYQIPAGPNKQLPYTPKDEAKLKKELFSLNDYELEMLQQRNLNSLMAVSDYNQQIMSGNYSDEERQYRVAMGDASMDAGIYGSLLRQFADGPFTETADIMRGANDPYLDRYSRTAQAASSGLTEAQNQKVAEGTSFASGAGNDFSFTPEAKKIEAAQADRMRALFKKGRGR